MLLAYEVTRDLPPTTISLDTLMPDASPMIDGKKLALVSILRAGNGLLDGLLEVIRWPGSVSWDFTGTKNA